MLFIYTRLAMRRHSSTFCSLTVVHIVGQKEITKSLGDEINEMFRELSSGEDSELDYDSGFIIETGGGKLPARLA
jgi:hypothetical protein